MVLPIIGLGAICAAGSSVEAGADALLAGADGILPFAGFDTGLKTPPLCAAVKEELDPEAPNRTTALALHAARQALASLGPRASAPRAGIVFASTVAGMTRSEIFYRDYLADPSTISRASEELAYHEPGACAGWLCRTLGLKGFHTLSTACSTGLHAIGLAKRLVEAGVYDACLAVGADALSVLTIRGFSSLLLIDPRGCRPFDRQRAGISLGEGAGAVLVASEGCSRDLTAPIAMVAGWGASADGHHMTAPHPEGRGAIAAVRAALDDAGMSPEGVDLIAAHGTGTPDNDAAEIKAVRAVFGTLPPFCSMKRTLGHTLAASGALEAALAIACMGRGDIPPTAGFAETDPAIGASPSPHVRSTFGCVLKTSFGFGGNNAAMILTRAGDR